MHSTSASLLRRLCDATDQAAWSRFVRLYTPLLYYWGRRAGLQESDAADLVQDVLMLLLRKLPEFTAQGHGSFRTWLRTVTLNKWRDRCRAAKVLPVTVEFPSEPAVPDAASEFDEAEHRQHLIRRALRLMQADFQPATWRACWELVVVGRPAAEIAGELGLTVGAVHAAKFRVVARLRQELDGLLD